jgi:xanthine dehydrogenase YagR molybdenum-binding subunit
VIGAPLSRVEGPLKATGTAIYPYEDWSAGQPLYGVIVGATIGHGTIARIDTARAEQAPGVRRVLTYRDKLAQQGPKAPEFDRYRTASPMIHAPIVRWFGDPVALVVATTFEQARAAANLVAVEYAPSDGRYDFAAFASQATIATAVNASMPPVSKVGDFDAAFAAAAIKLDQLYTTPYEFSQPLEPHGCIASWDGSLLTVHVSTQLVNTARLRIAATLGLDPAQVRILSRYVGGGFGSKLGVHAETILAALAARELRTPVKVVITRQQAFQLVGQRPAMRQRVRLGADRDGRLVAFGHDAVMKASADDDYIEQVATCGRALYAAANRLTVHMGVELNLPHSEDVRAPGEAPGMLAIECAMDELAHQLSLDPIELRVRNEPQVHPELNIPFSDRHLVECYRTGATRFGWDRRPKAPASVRDGDWLVGYGMSAAIRPHFQLATTVRVRLDADGTATVLSDMTDLGTGTYTILTQVAADALGLPIECVRVVLGDSTLPTSFGSGGSFGATNSTNATYRACLALRDQLKAAGATVTDVGRHFPSGLEAEGSIKNQWEDPAYQSHSMSGYGAHFAEVHVDAHTAEIRVRRMLGVFDAGRIFNAKTARSQLIGGMIWGISAALHEEGVVDVRYGSFINRDFAQYLVPVHADVPDVDAILLDTFDAKANDLGAKGVGELGICGAGAAIANAVFNATGIRVRSFPITVEKLL